MNTMKRWTQRRKMTSDGYVAVCRLATGEAFDWSTFAPTRELAEQDAKDSKFEVVRIAKVRITEAVYAESEGGR